MSNHVEGLEDLENTNSNNSDVSSVKLVTIISPKFPMNDSTSSINPNSEINSNLANDAAISGESNSGSASNNNEHIISISGYPSSTDGCSNNSGDDCQTHRQQQKAQLKIERTKKNEKLMCITHVSLNLEQKQQRPFASNNWKYIAIRKSPFTNLNLSRANEHRIILPADTTSGYLIGTGLRTNNTHNYINIQLNNQRPVSSNRFTNTENENDLNNNYLTIMKQQQQQQNNNNKNVDRSRAVGSPLFQQQQQQQQLANHNKVMNGSSSTSGSQKPSAKRDQLSMNGAQKVSYIDLIRSKSSTGESSICSVETQRSTGRHNYTVSEFNRFKNKLLNKSAMINSYSYDNVNTNNNINLANNNNNSIDGLNGLNNKQLNDISRSLFIQTLNKSQNQSSTSPTQQTYPSQSANNAPPKPTSQIRSIYETIQRSNNFYHSRMPSAEIITRRSNNSNNPNTKANHDLLSNSLSIKKL